jgi:hypothetical protein
MARRFTRSTEVQSVLFDRRRWTVTAAKKWLRDHGYKVPAVDSTEEYHRFRQRPPFQFQKGTFRTISFGRTSEGIKAVIAVPRSSSSRTSSKTKKNPTVRKRRSRIPTQLVDLAWAREIELEDGSKLKFPLSGKYALCCTGKGDELWILSKSRSRNIDTQDGEKYRKVFEKFTGFESDDIGTMVTPPSAQLVRVGRATSIVYRSDKFSRSDHDYIHPFKVPPTVSVDNRRSPQICAIRGGRIRVTAEGITG